MKLHQFCGTVYIRDSRMYTPTVYIPGSCRAKNAGYRAKRESIARGRKEGKKKKKKRKERREGRIVTVTSLSCASAFLTHSCSYIFFINVWRIWVVLLLLMQFWWSSVSWSMFDERDFGMLWARTLSRIPAIPLAKSRHGLLWYFWCKFFNRQNSQLNIRVQVYMKYAGFWRHSCRGDRSSKQAPPTQTFCRILAGSDTGMIPWKSGRLIWCLCLLLRVMRVFR